MGDMPTGEPMSDQDHLMKLIGMVTELGNRQADADKTVDGLMVAVGKVAQGLQELSEKWENGYVPPGPHGPWWWPTMTRSEADNAWQLLKPWVEGIMDRYQMEKLHGVRKCWFAHGQLVDEFSGLYHYWWTAFGSKAGAVMPIDWVQRYMPTLIDHVRTAGKICDPVCKVLGVNPAKVTNDHWLKFNAADLDARDGRRPSRNEKPA